MLLLCVTQMAAQSGRRPKTTSPPPTPVEQKTAPAESPRITSMIIGGHNIDPGTKEYWSTDVSTVAKGCTDRFKESPPLDLGINYGGKMTKTQAIERAKKEASSYVLWFGYRSKQVGLDFIVDYIDYMVLIPQTAKTLTEGRVYPAKQKTSADPGGIMRLPSRDRKGSNNRLLEQGGREIADRVRDLL